MSAINYSADHYTVRAGCLGIERTDSRSESPKDSARPFYQERQSGGKCSIHALNAFAGRDTVSIEDMITSK